MKMVSVLIDIDINIIFDAFKKKKQKTITPNKSTNLRH
jgi:hypothetical protein